MICLITGENLTMEVLSPSLMILKPPEKLVLEVQTSGHFFALEWRKDSNYLGSPGFSTTSFTHFSEVYYVENTSAVHMGRYEARLIPFKNSAQMPPSPIIFDVLLHGIPTS